MKQILRARARPGRRPSRHSRASRRATNVAALLAHPAFYHLRPIVVVGTVTLQDDGEMRVGDDSGSVRVVFKGTPPDGPAEVRGEFWDLGRMNADDPRLAGYDLRSAFRIDPEGAWPRPGQVTAIVATAIAAAVAAVGALGAQRGAVSRRGISIRRSRSPVSSPDATCSAICPTRPARAATTSCCARPTPPSG